MLSTSQSSHHDTNGMRQAGGRSGCPYTATKAFIGRQAAFITNAFSFSKPSAKGIEISIPASKALSFLTTKEILRNIDIAAMKPRQMSVALSATVDSAQEATSVAQKKKNKGSTVTALEVMVIGLSHHNARVDVREKLAIPEAQWNDASTTLCSYDSIAEASVLSTCNRFEIYLAGQNQYECIRDAIDFLQKRAGGTLDQETLRRNLFMLSGEDAIWHLLRVSAGLDSLVVGEGQILAQVTRFEFA